MSQPPFPSQLKIMVVMMTLISMMMTAKMMVMKVMVTSCPVV